jgi:hypothetical protein
MVVYVGHPYGGWDWGDRFLTPAIPLLCAPLGTLRGRWIGVAAAVVAIGMVSQVPNKLAFYERAYAEHRREGTPLEHNRWSAELSPLVVSWPAMMDQLEAASASDVNRLAVTAGGESAESVEDEEMFRVVALWWWMLPVVGISQWAGLAVSLLILAAGARLLWLAGSGLGP